MKKIQRYVLYQMRDGAECETEIVLPVELIKRESTGEL